MTKPTNPLVGVVVLNWNGGDDTVDCIRSLAKLAYDPYRIILVDNGSEDDSLERVRGMKIPQLEFVQNGENLGYAEGNNRGIRVALAAGAEYLLIVNNDTVVDADICTKLVAAAQANPSVGVFGARIYYLNDPEVIWFAGAKWNSGELNFEYPGQGLREKEFGEQGEHTDYACGAALFFRADVVRAIGAFDSRFFLVYEESDWCLRARSSGFGCKMVPAAKVWHKVGGSFMGEQSPLRVYFSVRNRLLWSERHLPFRIHMRLVLRAIRVLLPRISLVRTSGTPFGKRFVWSIVESFGDVKRRRTSVEIAKRAGVRDYLLRRFGDCPVSIRGLTEEC